MSAGGAVRTLVVVCAQWPVVTTGRPPEVPVAVLHANRCVAVSPGAMAHGVEPGLRRREAQARCPSIELFERDEQREARLFDVVLSELEQIVPRLEVVDAGRCALPTRGPSRYHGGDRALAHLVHERVRSVLSHHVGDGALPCPVGVGIADGPRAAMIAAHESVDSLRGERPLVVPKGATAAFLAPLPVGHLRHARGDPHARQELIEVLGRLGLRTIGRVAALPAPDVQARFGALGVQLHRLANGVEVEPPEVGAAPLDLRVHAAVDPPAERVDRAAFVAKALADTLQAELASRGLACTRVLVVAETDAGDRIERLWRHEGALSAAAVAQRVRWQLDGWLSTGRALGRCHGGVNHLELVPDQVVPDRGVQMGFWGGTSDEGERAARAMARVQALVGAEAVLVPEWRGARAPGEQYVLVPLDGVDLGGRPRPGDEPWPGRIPTPSPAVVWTRPRPAEVLDAEGRRVGVGGRGLLSAAPARCWVPSGGGAEGEWGEIRAWAGPWCIEERWWDALAHRRRARLQAVVGPPGGVGPGRSHPSRGVAHLLTLEGGRWWVEATYD